MLILQCDSTADTFINVLLDAVWVLHLQRSIRAYELSRRIGKENKGQSGMADGSMFLT